MDLRFFEGLSLVKDLDEGEFDGPTYYMHLGS